MLAPGLPLLWKQPNPQCSVCELVLNEDHYLQPSIVSFCSESSIISKNVLLATSASFHKASDTCIDQTFLSSVQVCFQFDCCDTTKLGKYSNLWHMHVLASVLKQPIQSVYPDLNSLIRPFYPKILLPRRAESAPHKIPYIMMWTRALPVPFNDSWTPNRFVPCQMLPIQGISKEMTLTTEPKLKVGKACSQVKSSSASTSKGLRVFKSPKCTVQQSSVADTQPQTCHKTMQSHHLAGSSHPQVQVPSTTDAHAQSPSHAHHDHSIMCLHASLITLDQVSCQADSRKSQTQMLSTTNAHASVPSEPHKGHDMQSQHLTFFSTTYHDQSPPMQSPLPHPAKSQRLCIPENNSIQSHSQRASEANAHLSRIQYSPQK